MTANKWWAGRRSIIEIDTRRPASIALVVDVINRCARRWLDERRPIGRLLFSKVVVFSQAFVSPPSDWNCVLFCSQLSDVRRHASCVGLLLRVLDDWISRILVTVQILELSCGPLKREHLERHAEIVSNNKTARPQGRRSRRGRYCKLCWWCCAGQWRLYWTLRRRGSDAASSESFDEAQRRQQRHQCSWRQDGWWKLLGELQRYVDTREFALT